MATAGTDADSEGYRLERPNTAPSIAEPAALESPNYSSSANATPVNSNRAPPASLSVASQSQP